MMTALPSRITVDCRGRERPVGKDLEKETWIELEDYGCGDRGQSWIETGRSVA